jgi:dTDP-4-dehydrorhamnose reductase
MKVAILGGGGQLASDLVGAMSDWDVVPFTHEALDVCNSEALVQVLSETQSEVIVNAAAFHRVDDCEDDPGKAFLVNACAVRRLAQICAEHGWTLVQISTDYVFGGQKTTPYSEEDTPHPINVYGVSKVAGEYFALDLCPKTFVVRVSGLFGAAGSSGKGGNFVETMIHLAKANKSIRVVDDQVFSPSYTRDLAFKIKELIQTGEYGLYHMTNSDQCSWYEFAGEIFALLGLEPDLGPTTTESYGLKAARPKYSVLANNRLKRIGLSDLPPWRQALRAYLVEKSYLEQSRAFAANLYT